jgi:hypothetical protein
MTTLVKPEKPATPILDRQQAPHVGGWTRRADGPVDPVTGEKGYLPCRLVDHSNLIGSFLDWLSANGVRLAKYAPDPVEMFDEDDDIVMIKDALVPDGRSFNRILHDYFDMDENAEEAERMALLAYVRDSYEYERAVRREAPDA